MTYCATLRCVSDFQERGSPYNDCLITEMLNRSSRNEQCVRSKPVSPTCSWVYTIARINDRCLIVSIGIRRDYSFHVNASTRAQYVYLYVLYVYLYVRLASTYLSIYVLLYTWHTLTPTSSPWPWSPAAQYGLSTKAGSLNVSKDKSPVAQECRSVVS